MNSFGVWLQKKKFVLFDQFNGINGLTCTVNFTLLNRAVLRSSLGNWELHHEVANYIAR